MPIDNRIESLHLKFQPIAGAWFDVVKAYILPARWPGWRVRITETKRDVIRQEELEAKGASKLKVGYHNFGRAFDFALFDEHGVYEANDSQGAYLACGQIAEALGCEWGGRWETFKDLGHVQYRPDGVTITTLSGDLIT